MKKVLLLPLTVLSLLNWAESTALAQDAGLDISATSPIWNLTQGISAPESAYFDEGTQHIYVSNVAGDAKTKDGVGWISKIGLDGTVVAEKFVDGLNAPKGLRSFKGNLWVSDIDQLVEIELASGKILRRVRCEGATFLNDVAIDGEGVVYASDTLSSTIYQNTDGKCTVFAEGDQLESPNGLLVEKDSLVVAAWGKTTDFSTKVPGRLFRLNLKSKKKTLITKQPLGNLDGLEPDKDGGYFVSDWAAGKVYRVSRSGKATLFLRGMKGAADIGVIPKQKVLVIPRMGENAVTALSIANPGPLK